MLKGLDTMSFGNRLRELRITKGLTQQQLADTIKLSKANVSKYEADLVEPNLDTLRLLSEFFNVSIDYLLGQEKIKVAHDEPPLSQDLQDLLTVSFDLSREDLQKVREYVELLKLKHNS